MNIKKITALACIFVFGASIVSGVSAKAVLDSVSPALEVVAYENKTAMSCFGEREISLDAEKFEKALNLSSVKTVTITRIPERSEGIMYLAGSEISEGQTISRANLSYLKFEFLGEGINQSSFCYSVNDSAYEIECALYSLKQVNYAPNVNIDAATQASTYKNVGLFGRLKAYDPEGDDISFEVVKQPANGLLSVSKSGEYIYTPSSGFVGNDSFKYVACDQYGNYSVSKEIELKVEEQSSSLVFKDITDSEYHVAAINMAERGIISVSQIDGEYYFYPGYDIGRLEFLVMAMKVMGIEMEVDDTKTVFADDADIPQSLKEYVNTAVKLGYVSGKINNEGELVFCPNDRITKAEAAVIVYNMTKIDDPIVRPVFADSNTVPSWAETAVYNLCANGIYPKNGSNVSANSLLNRDECAYMLYQTSQKRSK